VFFSQARKRAYFKIVAFFRAGGPKKRNNFNRTSAEGARKGEKA
jgi:hypothetical protein